MKKNMGIADKVIRVIIAAVILTLYFTNVISGILGIVLIVLSGVFILTSLISFCPLYTILGFSSRRAKQK
jgi:hypothetical protein